MRLPSTFAALTLLVSPAFAACTDVAPNAATYVDDPPTASVAFDAFVLNAGDTRKTCALETPARESGEAPLTGVISAYSADYRGFVGPDRVARLVVTESGVTRTVTIAPDTNDVLLHSYVGTNAAGVLRSDITLSVAGNDQPLAAQLDTVDYLFLGSTSLDVQLASLDLVSTEATALVTHLNTTAGVVVNTNGRLERPDQVGVFGAVGSYNVGVTGHYNLGGGISFDAGVSLFDQSVGGSSSSGLLIGGKANYLQPEDGSSFRWLGSAGLTAAPNMNMSFSRSYTITDINGVPSTVQGTASGNGTMVGAWVEGGVLFAPDPNNEIIFSASYSRNWLNFGDVAEKQTDTNPFAFSSDSTSTFDTLKAKADWTTTVTPDVDLTLHAAVGHVFASDMTSNVALVGPLTVVGQDETFAEYGARVDWQFADNAELGVFALGSTGSVTGTHFQVGTAVSMKF